jgi:hypothetical protein
MTDLVERASARATPETRCNRPRLASVRDSRSLPMRPHWLSLFPVGALALIAACSSPGPLSIEQACNDYTKIYRQRETECYGVAPEPDEASLIDRETTACVRTSEAPGSHVGASYWGQCAADANNACGAYQCGTYPAGAGQTGAPCFYATECETLWCRGTVVTAADGSVLGNAAQCGVCATRLAAGSRAT